MADIIGARSVQVMRKPEKFGLPAPVSVPRTDKINSLRVSDSSVAEGYNQLSEVDPTTNSPYSLSRTPLGPISPFFIPNVYTDPTGNSEAIRKVRYDGIAALNFALRYSLTKDPTAAMAARAQIVPWLSINSFSVPAGSDTRLSWSYTWPMFISASMLIRDSTAWTPGDDTLMRQVTQLALDKGVSTAYTNPANQGAWGVVYELSSSSLLGDRTRFRNACAAWKSNLNSFLENNVPIEEVHRQGGSQGNGSSGLYYSMFYLTALVYGAEWARFNGEWLYDYETQDGSSLRGLYEKVASWARYPETFSYNTSGTVTNLPETFGSFQVLNQLWPNPDAEWLLSNKIVADRYGLRYLTLTHASQPLRG